jgi:xanthine dehydrogenase YagR molybdenum-binding subunit
MTDVLAARSVGTDRVRADARLKVTGAAPYADEHPTEHPAHAFVLQADIARGTVTSFGLDAALAVEGVLFALTHEDAPRLRDPDPELAVLQSPEIAFRGQIIGAIVAETPEAAREAARLVVVAYARRDHDVVLRADHPDAYAPEEVNGGFPTDTSDGDVEAELAAAAWSIDATYETPYQVNVPLEPHTTIATWAGEVLTLQDSTQGVHTVRSTVAPLLGLDEEQVHVEAPYVGGGFGSKGEVHANVVLAAMLAQRLAGRPVKLPLTRQQTFTVAGHRPATIQRVRLAADADGRLTALAHDAIGHTSRIDEYAEQTAVRSRSIYAAQTRSTSHRLVPLDVAVPSWMRAPGECPGSFGAEVAMDELSREMGIDPVELRLRNDTDVDPVTGLPWSSRGLAECLRSGAERFGWAERGPEPGSRVSDGWRVGLGVAAAAYPVDVMPGSEARVRAMADRRYEVAIGAADIGTGAWTALAQIAADALEVAVEQVDLHIGDSALPKATVAGGSSGTYSWGSAIVTAARKLRSEHGRDPEPGAEVTSASDHESPTDRYAMRAFGAQFAEVRVHALTGEVRVPRMLGVFAAGRIVNPRTARSQFLGGMVMGLSMALHEQAVLDPTLGHLATHDLAEYQVAAHADVADLQATWIDEHDPHVNVLGAKGIGEIGIVGSAAAIANATHDATGVRVRSLPLTPDHFLP